jgi:hypothetical protein
MTEEFLGLNHCVSNVNLGGTVEVVITEATSYLNNSLGFSLFACLLG